MRALLGMTHLAQTLTGFPLPPPRVPVHSWLQQLCHCILIAVISFGAGTVSYMPRAYLAQCEALVRGWWLCECIAPQYSKVFICIGT